LSELSDIGIKVLDVLALARWQALSQVFEVKKKTLPRESKAASK
jgi:hypothetical protein